MAVGGKLSREAIAGARSVMPRFVVSSYLGRSRFRGSVQNEPQAYESWAVRRRRVAAGEVGGRLVLKRRIDAATLVGVEGGLRCGWVASVGDIIIAGGRVQ